MAHPNFRTDCPPDPPPLAIRQGCRPPDVSRKFEFTPVGGRVVALLESGIGLAVLWLPAVVGEQRAHGGQAPTCPVLGRVHGAYSKPEVGRPTGSIFVLGLAPL